MAPLSNGGTAVRTYEYSLNAGRFWATRATGTTATVLEITRLKAKTTYRVAVRAVNKAGPGTRSLVVKVTTK